MSARLGTRAVPPGPAQLRFQDGSRRPMAMDRWFGEPETVDREVIARAIPPVLDVGCGPGRHVLALAAAGIPALGLDVAPSAVAHARSQGACVLERSVFDRVPAAGRWGSALLLDGNAGIGGDPAALLSRVESLLAPGGCILVEVEAPGIASGAMLARIEAGQERSCWFPWARVGADDLPSLAGSCRLRIGDIWEQAGRWFALLAVAR